MNSLATRWHVGLSVAVLLAWLLPEWAAYAKSPIFVFVNGWDEETYLSWQGVLGSRNEIGYFTLWPYSVLHSLGVPGVLQNLWSDTLLPLASVALVWGALRRFGITSAHAFAYAVLILFSSTLFNYANPVVQSLLGEYDGRAWLMAGWERYPSILRTPNPQASFFLIALAIHAWARWRRDWLLLLPLPLLYYFIAVPYAAALALAAGWRIWTKRHPQVGYVALPVGGVLLWLAMGAGAGALFWLVGYYAPDHWVRQDPWVFAATRRPQLPLALLFFALTYVLFRGAGKLGPGKWPRLFLLTLGIVALATVNLHVLTGFMLSQKNYYDYGLSVVFGLMLVTGVHLIQPRRLSDAVLGVLLTGVFVPTLASHLYFYERAVTIGARAAPLAAAVRQDPLHALIFDREVSSRIAYAHAQLLAPPFSYQYYFSFIERQCAYYPALLDAAVTEANRVLPALGTERAMLDETIRIIREGQARATRLAYQNPTYCTPQAYTPRGFTVFGTSP